MAKNGPLTPERQLLKLIEEKGAEAVNLHKMGKLKHRGLSFVSLPAWIGRFSFFKTSFKERFQELRSHPFDIKYLNKIIGILIFVLAIYFFSSVFSIFRQFRRISFLETNLQASTTNVSQDTRQITLLKNTPSYYMGKVRERDIFKIGKSEASPGKVVSVSKGPSSKIIEATQHLRLVGISWSSDPDAMIEDTRAMRTFFIKRGQKIGDIKVEAIFKDKIILSYEGEEIELR